MDDPLYCTRPIAVVKPDQLKWLLYKLSYIGGKLKGKVQKKSTDISSKGEHAQLA
jgi:hypothetical protein